jgi:molecular chaperone Hsp33
MTHQALIKALSKDGQAVVYTLDATSVVQESMERIGSYPPATKHLGQAMMAAVLLQALTDSETNETLGLQWSNTGPFGTCFAESRNFGEVRGTITYPQAPVMDYETKMGEGVLQVRRRRGPIDTASTVKAVGDVSLDVVEFLENSEQKNCGINLSVVIGIDPDNADKFIVKEALGYLIHILPQATPEKATAALVNWNSQMLALGAISQWALREGQKNVDMARMLLSDNNPNIVMSQRVEFACTCSEERAARALALAEDQEEREGFHHAGKQTEITCEFCGQHYILTAETMAAWRAAHGKKA